MSLIYNNCPPLWTLVLTFLVLPFWYLLTRVVPDKFQKSSKTVVCVWSKDLLHTTEISYGALCMNILNIFLLGIFSI